MEEREESGLTCRACNWPPVFNSLSLFEFFFVHPTEHSCKTEPRRLWHVHWPTMSDDIQDDPQALRRFRLLPQPHHCQGHHHPSITLFLFPSMSRSPCVRPLPVYYHSKFSPHFSPCRLDLGLTIPASGKPSEIGVQMSSFSPSL